MGDPKTIVILFLLGIGYQGYNKYVRPVAVKVEHTVKETGKKVGHVLGKLCKLIPHTSEGE